MSNNDDEGLESRDALGDDDIDEEKLKGDAIGDTLYSEKWLIQTLMKLTQVGEMDRLSFSDCMTIPETKFIDLSLSLPSTSGIAKVFDRWRRNRTCRTG